MMIEQLLLETELLQSYQASFNPNDEKQVRSICRDLFDIDLDKFNKIHTVASKKAYLRYRFLRAELLVVEVSQTIEADPQALFALLDQAYTALSAEASPLLKNHHSDYSMHSLGLSQFDVRATYQNDVSAPVDGSSLFQSIVNIGQKGGGIEPGFQAIQTQDILLFIDEICHFSRDERTKLYKIHGVDIKNIYTAYESELPKYLLKLTYDTITDGGVLQADLENIRKTSTIRGLESRFFLVGYLAAKGLQYLKCIPLNVKNIEALREVIANDVARVCGMPVQTQYLERSVLDGRIQLLLKGKWVKNASELRALGGSLPDKNQNYLVRSVVLPQNGISQYSDPSLTNLAKQLPLMIVQGDYDGIGSTGVNKLRAGNQMVGIDFGHSYQMSKDKVSTFINKEVTPDFHIQNSKFKNFTLFYDAPRTEFVKGLLRLAKLANYPLSPKIIQSYDSDPIFINEMANVQPDADSAVFDDYLRKLEELKTEACKLKDTDNKDACVEMITKVSESKANAIAARNTLIEKFKPYLNLEMNCITLIENLEKYLAGPLNTTLRSANKAVILNHLQITSNRPNIEAKLINDCYYQISLLGKINPKDLTALQHRIRTYHSESRFLVDVNKHPYVMTFPQKELSSICAILTEEFIQEQFHKNDYLLQQQYQNEYQITELLASFKQYQVQLQLIAHPTEKNYYQIIDATPATVQEHDPLFWEFYSEIKVPNLSMFTNDDLVAVIFKLKTIQACIAEFNQKMGADLQLARNKLNSLLSTLSFAPIEIELIRSGHLVSIQCIHDTDPRLHLLLEQHLKPFYQPTLSSKVHLLAMAQAVEQVFIDYLRQLEIHRAFKQEFTRVNALLAKTNQTLHFQIQAETVSFRLSNLCTSQADICANMAFVSEFIKFRRESSVHACHFDNLHRLIATLDRFVSVYQSNYQRILNFADNPAARLKAAQEKTQSQVEAIHAARVSLKETLIELNNMLDRPAPLNPLTESLKNTTTWLVSSVFFTKSLVAPHYESTARAISSKLTTFLAKSSYLADEVQDLYKDLFLRHTHLIKVLLPKSESTQSANLNLYQTELAIVERALKKALFLEEQMRAFEQADSKAFMVF